MNPAQLLAHFDRISEVPDAIPRLRRLVLDLAVRGKLVEQDPNGEPVSELLKRIQAEKVRLAKDRNVGRQEHLPEIRPEGTPFDISPSWRWVRLGTIAQVVMGQSPPGETYNKVGDGIPLINGPVEFTDGPFGRTVLNQYTTAPTNLCEEGDLLICVRGSTTGRTNIAGFRACIGRGVAAIRPFFVDEYVRRFIWWSRESIISMGRGIAFPSVSRQQIEEMPVPLPSLAEQHRIVAKLDELMGLCDRLELAQVKRERRRDRLVAASLHRLNNGAEAAELREHAQFYLRHFPRLTSRPEDIQQLRKTILNLAVRGKLVEQDPNDEPASLLLDRLKSVLAKSQANSLFRNRREILPAVVDFFGDEAFPDSWAVTNFDSVNAIVSGVAKGKNLQGLKTATHPYLRVANVQRGYLDLGVVKELEIRADEFDRYRLRRGDVLMTEGGDWDKLGRAAIWNEEVPNCIHQNHIYRIRSANKDELLPDWIALFANCPLGRSYFEGASKRTTNLASINMTQLRSCPLPLPPLPEQHRIVAKVDELMALCDQLETQLATAQTERRHLIEAIVHQTLNGDLQ